MTVRYIDYKDSKYVEAFSYPAGERQVRITPGGIIHLKGATRVVVRATVRSSQDIIDLALFKNALDEVCPYDHTEHVLSIPYLPYARADRRFVDGDCNGLNVIASLLFAMSWDRIVTLDVHSGEAEKYVPELVNVEPTLFVRAAVEDFAITTKADKVIVILPDEGAAKRYKIPDHYGCNVRDVEVDIKVCSKKRDAATGKLLGFEVPEIKHPAIIIDDLCDGGGTFLGIASQIRNQYDDLHVPPLGLYVTHGIFSKGIGDLNLEFKRIYTTNSYYDGRFGRFVDEFNAFMEMERNVNL